MEKRLYEGKMIYLNKISISNNRLEKWPFNIKVISTLNQLSFKTPVTFIAGENGTGKSTLVESLAIKLKMPAIGRVDAVYDDTLKQLDYFVKNISLTMRSKPRNKFFLRSEDFFNFVLKLNKEQDELRKELHRVDIEYKDKSQFTKNQARSAYLNSHYQMKKLYGEDMLENASHGESFIRLFNNRIRPNGLYILDEPAVPLSPLRQLSLLHIIKEMSEEHNCQFIIATHSPILLAYKEATIFSLNNDVIENVKWRDLESVQLLKDFLIEPDRYIDKL